MKSKFVSSVAALMAAITLTGITLPAVAQSSQGSLAVSQGIATVLSGSTQTLVGSGQVVVESVKWVGDSAVIVVKSLPDLSLATIKVSGAAAGAVTMASGELIKLVTHAAGTLLVKGGEVLAVIPNEVGKALLHQSVH